MVHKTWLISCTVWGALLAASPAWAQSAKTLSPGDSITQAVQNSFPGATIRLKPGEYNEYVVIDRSITLVGLGKKPDDVRIVNPDQDELVAQDTAAQNSNGDGIYITSDAKNVTLKNFQVLDFDGNGIFATNTGKLVCELLIVNDHDYNGIQVNYEDDTPGKPEVHITHSQIFGNFLDGVDLNGTGDAYFSHCQITGNGQDLFDGINDGIDVDAGKNVTVLYCDLSNNTEDGLDVDGDDDDNTSSNFGDIVVQHTTANGNGGCGFDLDEVGKVTFVRVEASRNGYSGEIDGGGDGVNVEDFDKLFLLHVIADQNNEDGFDLDLDENGGSASILGAFLQGRDNGDDGIDIDNINGPVTLISSLFQNNDDNGVEYNGDTSDLLLILVVSLNNGDLDFAINQ